MAKEDGYIDVGGFVVETPDKLIEKAKKAFQKDNTELPMPLVNQVLSELIGEPTKKEKQDIREKVITKGRPKTAPASELAEMVTGMVIECGWRYDPKYDTSMFYQSKKGTWRREEYKDEYKHFVQDLFLRESIPTPGGLHLIFYLMLQI